MANKKFSEFTTRTDSANVDFLVGYDGSTNVKIAPSNVGGGGADTARFNHNFNHSSNSPSLSYYLPCNTLGESSGPNTNEPSGIVALNDGYVSKVRMTIVDTEFVSGFATQTRILVEVNGTTVYTSAYNSHGTLTQYTSVLFTLGATDAPFSAGEQVVVRFQADGIWYRTHAITEHTYS
jgi:hypothetical protein